MGMFAFGMIGIGVIAFCAALAGSHAIKDYGNTYIDDEF